MISQLMRRYEQLNQRAIGHGRGGRAGGVEAAAAAGAAAVAAIGAEAAANVDAAGGHLFLR